MKNIEINQYQKNVQKEIQPGIELFFEKYFNNINLNTIKTHIYTENYMGSFSLNCFDIDGYVNNDENKNFSFTISPEDNYLGFVVVSTSYSNDLCNMEKYEYSDDNPSPKPMAFPDTLLLQKMKEEKSNSKESKK